MATRTQKVKVGIFLVICFVLVVVGLVLISGYKHEERFRYWIEFEESVLGLSEGGTVEYLGVPVGAVDKIYVTDEGHAHVEILVSTSKVTLHKGVEAKLVLYSLATGVLVVSLEGGDRDAPILPANSQIPTKPSFVEAVSSRMEGILDNIGDVAGMIRDGMKGMEEGDLARIADKIDALVTDADEFLDDVDKMLGDVQEDVQGGIGNFRELTDDLKELTSELRETAKTTRNKIESLEVGETRTKINEVLEAMTKLVEQVQRSVETIEKVSESALHEVDNVEYGMRETLRSATEALESIRIWMESLEDDPTQLIRGKGKPVEEK